MLGINHQNERSSATRITDWFHSWPADSSTFLTALCTMHFVPHLYELL